jgi:hypothetical protein
VITIFFQQLPFFKISALFDFFLVFFFLNTNKFTNVADFQCSRFLYRQLDGDDRVAADSSPVDAGHVLRFFVPRSFVSSFNIIPSRKIFTIILDSNSKVHSTLFNSENIYNNTLFTSYSVLMGIT